MHRPSFTQILFFFFFYSDPVVSSGDARLGRYIWFECSVWSS